MSLSRKYINAKLQGAFTGNQAKVLGDLFEGVQADSTATAAAFNALVAKLNTDFTEQNLLNAFPLTLDTNYASVSTPTQGL